MIKTYTNNVCTECSKRQLSCCQDSDPFVTLGDIKRISMYYGDDFYENVDAAQIYLDCVKEQNDPLWDSVTIRNGKRRVIKKGNDNISCYFLTKNGCMLPTELKPLVCRLYPYGFTENGLFISESAGCPTDLVGDNQPKAVGINEKDAVYWHEELYKELLEERKRGKL